MIKLTERENKTVYRDGNRIIKEVGQGKINELNILEDDFDYTAKS